MPAKAILVSIGHHHPQHRIANSFFDKLDIGSCSSWVEERTGICSRASVLSEDDLEQLSQGKETLLTLRAQGKVLSLADMAKPAWNMALQRLEAPVPAIDTLICGTSIPDYDIPANACSVAAALNIEATAFDVNSACASFVVDLHVARQLIAGGSSRSIALVNPERYSLRLNFQDKTSCVLFGDASTAAILSSDSHATSGFEILDTYVASSPSKFDLVKIPDSDFFSQNGKAVQKFAITRTIEITEAILQRQSLKISDVSYFIGHQANLRMLTSAMEKLDVPPHKHLYNVDRFGNQGGAGAPAVLSENWQCFKSGDLVVVSVVGSGLTWGSALLRYL